MTLCVRLVELQMRAKRGKGWCVSSVAPPVFLFCLLNGGNIENGRGLRAFVGLSLWEIESQFSLRVGMSAGGGVEFL